jgi:hypothetical protein
VYITLIDELERVLCGTVWLLEGLALVFTYRFRSSTDLRGFRNRIGLWVPGTGALVACAVSHNVVAAITTVVV